MVPSLIEVMESGSGRYTVTVWFGLVMDCEREFTSLSGALAYLSARFGSDAAATAAEGV